jgi:hypothetical protein
MGNEDAAEFFNTMLNEKDLDCLLLNEEESPDDLLF